MDLRCSDVLKNVRAGRVRVAKGAPAPAMSNPPLPQVGIVPGTATTASGEAVDVAALGPDPTQPLFSVRMVLPIPPVRDLPVDSSHRR